MFVSNYKIVIIGESMVGKTSILLRYIKGKFIKVGERTINTNCFKKTISINNMIERLHVLDRSVLAGVRLDFHEFHPNLQG